MCLSMLVLTMMCPPVIAAHMGVEVTEACSSHVRGMMAVAPEQGIRKTSARCCGTSRVWISV